MATADKLSYLKETKEKIKSAINAKGGAITDTTPFRDYEAAILDITTGEKLPVSEEGEF